MTAKTTPLAEYHHQRDQAIRQLDQAMHESHTAEARHGWLHVAQIHATLAAAAATADLAERGLDVYPQ